MFKWTTADINLLMHDWLLTFDVEETAFINNLAPQIEGQLGALMNFKTSTADKFVNFKTDYRLVAAQEIDLAPLLVNDAVVKKVY